MEDQPAPTIRQWLRLASLARLEALGRSAAPAAQRSPLPQPQPQTITPPGQAQTQPPRPPTTSTGNGAPPPPLPPPQATSLALDSPKPPPATPSPRFRAPSRSPTPTESPRVIKPTNPQEPPRIAQLRPIKAPPPQSPERERKQLAVAPSPKSPSVQRQVDSSDGGTVKTITDVNGKTSSMFAQQGNNNGGVKTIADVNGKTSVNGNQTKVNDARAPPPSSPKGGTTKYGVGMETAQKDNHKGERRFITMAGENVGAYLDLRSPYSHQHRILRKHQQGYHDYHQTKGVDESQGEDDGESKGSKKGDGEKQSVTAEGKPMASLVNSNVQSVNNSILFGTSCAQRSPGVHISLVSRQQPKHTETLE